MDILQAEVAKISPNNYNSKQPTGNGGPKNKKHHELSAHSQLELPSEHISYQAQNNQYSPINSTQQHQEEKEEDTDEDLELEIDHKKIKI